MYDENEDEVIKKHSSSTRSSRYSSRNLEPTKENTSPNKKPVKKDEKPSASKATKKPLDEMDTRPTKRMRLDNTASAVLPEDSHVAELF